jgi:hypothetical protein
MYSNRATAFNNRQRVLPTLCHRSVFSGGRTAEFSFAEIEFYKATVGDLA